MLTFSYSIGSGLGGLGTIIMLTRDGKEYVIGQEGFEGDWMLQREFAAEKNLKVRLTR